MTWRPKNLTATQREERRLEAGQLLRTSDLSQAAIARIVGVSRTAVTNWKQQNEDAACFFCHEARIPPAARLKKTSPYGKSNISYARACKLNFDGANNMRRRRSFA
jgi:transposase-like protein